jgi:hypothetical protein
LEVPVVLNKEELISSLKNEIRILVHLAGKVDRSQLDYRPAPKQRSTLELLRYLAIMGPTQLSAIRTGVFDRPTLSALWTPAVKASEAMDFDQAIEAIQHLSVHYQQVLGEWTEAVFREEVDFFGTKTSRGSFLVNHVLGAHAAYRTQLFCYLKSCGREELSTMNLWGGMDAPS